MKTIKVKKSMVIGIIILLVAITIIPVISGNAGLTSFFDKSDDTVDSSEEITSVKNKVITYITINSPLDGSQFLEPKPLQTKYIEIIVFDQFQSPIFDASIHVCEKDNPDFYWEGYTNIDGKVFCPTPNVNMDTLYQIEAVKIINGKILKDDIFVTVKNRILNISVDKNPVDEGNEFICTVFDQDNKPVSLAEVEFDGKIKYTDIFGKTDSFVAPWVERDTTFTIKASAPLRGYDNDYFNLIVKDCLDPTPQEVFGQIRNYEFIPMKNVKIEIVTEKDTYETETNEFGDYSCSFIPSSSGEYIKIKVSFSDYPSQIIKTWVNGKNQEPIHVNFWFVKENENGNQYYQEEQDQKQNVNQNV